MGLFRTVSEIDGDFSRKSQNFPTPLVFCDPTEGVSLGIGYRRRGQKTRMMGLPDWQKSLTMSSAVWIECTNVTDRRTVTGQRPRLRIASRGKNSQNYSVLVETYIQLTKIWRVF